MFKPFQLFLSLLTPQIDITKRPLFYHKSPVRASGQFLTKVRGINTATRSSSTLFDSAFKGAV